MRPFERAARPDIARTSQRLLYRPRDRTAAAPGAPNYCGGRFLLSRAALDPPAVDFDRAEGLAVSSASEAALAFGLIDALRGSSDRVDGWKEEMFVGEAILRDVIWARNYGLWS